MLKSIFLKLQTSPWAAVITIGGAYFVKLLLVYLLTKINSNPKDTAEFLNLFFLLF